MAAKDIFKISRKTFFNPSAWIDYQALVDQNKTIFSVIKNLFSKPAPAREETFEDALKRLKVNESDLPDMLATYRSYAAFFLLCGLVAFTYGFYLVFRHHTWIGFFLAESVCAYFLVQAFKYDFWALQLRRRTLGLTYADWKKSWLGE